MSRSCRRALYPDPVDPTTCLPSEAESWQAAMVAGKGPSPTYGDFADPVGVKQRTVAQGTCVPDTG